ncbi:MD-2-related lipid-recognition protein ROSY1 [Cardamine amara subsp. amara]|uniref:MD-2-related lipid-recognition protein ROSY1 n=1 Tax=Cardamine amara subsp. amara TaxID=228776 RepID=A0ABD0Z6P4_CARAN
MAISQAQPLLILLLLPLFFSSALCTTSFHYCDKRLDPVKVKGVEITPDPVVSGDAATFKISGSTGEDISGGEVVIKVSYFGIPVHTETHDLCDETACPIAPGSFVLSHSQTLPSITPPGTYTLKMTINDKNGGRLTCISFKFSIKLGSAVFAS